MQCCEFLRGRGAGSLETDIEETTSDCGVPLRGKAAPLRRCSPADCLCSLVCHAGLLHSTMASMRQIHIWTISSNYICPPARGTITITAYMLRQRACHVPVGHIQQSNKSGDVRICERNREGTMGGVSAVQGQYHCLRASAVHWNAEV